MEPIFGIPPETVRRYNSRLMDLYSLFMNLMPTAIDADSVTALAQDCNIPLSEAFAHYFAALMGVDAGGSDRLFFRHWLLPSIREASAGSYTNDAYFQNIKIPADIRGRWALKTEMLQPFEPFVCDDIVVTPDRRMIPQIAFFREEYPFPAVLENGREWMTLQPNEMVTTYPAIDAADGRVLTFGLGLGYFAYHASEKESVESVTVVDISDDVIELFRKHILPQFPHKEKIRLIKSDAFAFAETQMEGNFDFVFADIWHDAGDGRDLYLRMKEFEKRYPDIKFSFWLEDTIRCYLDEDLWDLPKRP